MILYHGGTDVVREPFLIPSTVGRDFGPGFYLTGIRAQAEKWAYRQTRIRRKEAFLNVYTFDEDAVSATLRIKKITECSLE
jgi:hypothetical protein